MRAQTARHYSWRVLDFSFFVGIALGTIVTGFCAIGAFDRGFDSARRKSWRVELEARNRAVLVAAARTPAEVRERDTRAA